MSDDPDLPDDSKLTRTKARWAEEGKFLTGNAADARAERLPPGQHLVKNWPVLDLGLTPNVSPTTWKLDITGLVDRMLVWNWADFRAQPQEQRVTDIHCVTTWSRYDNLWEGVSTRHLHGVAGVKSEARHVVLHSEDGYTTNLTLDDFLSPDALLVHSWAGKPLEPEHGGPVRLVVPHLYFWKSAKWLRRIEFVAEDRPGFWEVRGYHNRGNPWAEERYSA